MALFQTCQLSPMQRMYKITIVKHATTLCCFGYRVNGLYTVLDEIGTWNASWTEVCSSIHSLVDQDCLDYSSLSCVNSPGKIIRTHFPKSFNVAQECCSRLGMCATQRNNATQQRNREHHSVHH